MNEADQLDQARATLRTIYNLSMVSCLTHRETKENKHLLGNMVAIRDLILQHNRSTGRDETTPNDHQS